MKAAIIHSLAAKADTDSDSTPFVHEWNREREPYISLIQLKLDLSKEGANGNMHERILPPPKMICN